MKLLCVGPCLPSAQLTARQLVTEQLIVQDGMSLEDLRTLLHEVLYVPLEMSTELRHIMRDGSVRVISSSIAENEHSCGSSSAWREPLFSGSVSVRRSGLFDGSLVQLYCIEEDEEEQSLSRLPSPGKAAPKCSPPLRFDDYSLWDARKSQYQHPRVGGSPPPSPPPSPTTSPQMGAADGVAPPPLSLSPVITSPVAPGGDADASAPAAAAPAATPVAPATAPLPPPATPGPVATPASSSSSADLVSDIDGYEVFVTTPQPEVTSTDVEALQRYIAMVIEAIGHIRRRQTQLLSDKEAELESAVQKARDEIASVDAIHVLEVNQFRDSLAQTSERLAQVEAALSARERELSELRASISQAADREQALILERDRARAEHQEALCKQLSADAMRLESAAGRAAAEAAEAAAQKEISDWRRKHKIVEEDLTSNRDRRKTLAEQLQKIEEELASERSGNRNDVHSAHVAREALAAERQAADKRVKGAEKIVAQLTGERDRVQKALEDARATAAEQAQELLDARATEQCRIDSLQSSHDDECVRLNLAMTEHMDEVVRLRKTLDAKALEVRTAGQERTALERQMVIMQRDMDGLRTEAKNSRGRPERWTEPSAEPSSTALGGIDHAFQATTGSASGDEINTRTRMGPRHGEPPHSAWQGRGPAYSPGSVSTRPAQATGPVGSGAAAGDAAADFRREMMSMVEDLIEKRLRGTTEPVAEPPSAEEYADATECIADLGALPPPADHSGVDREDRDDVSVRAESVRSVPPRGRPLGSSVDGRASPPRAHPEAPELTPFVKIYLSPLKLGPDAMTRFLMDAYKASKDATTLRHVLTAPIDAGGKLRRSRHFYSLEFVSTWANVAEKYQNAPPSTSGATNSLGRLSGYKWSKSLASSSYDAITTAWEQERLQLVILVSGALEAGVKWQTILQHLYSSATAANTGNGRASPLINECQNDAVLKLNPCLHADLLFYRLDETFSRGGGNENSETSAYNRFVRKGRPADVDVETLASELVTLYVKKINLVPGAIRLDEESVFENSEHERILNDAFAEVLYNDQNAGRGAANVQELGKWLNEQRIVVRDGGEADAWKKLSCKFIARRKLLPLETDAFTARTSNFAGDDVAGGTQRERDGRGGRNRRDRPGQPPPPGVPAIAPVHPPPVTPAIGVHAAVAAPGGTAAPPPPADDDVPPVGVAYAGGAPAPAGAAAPFGRGGGRQGKGDNPSQRFGGRGGGAGNTAGGAAFPPPPVYSQPGASRASRTSGMRTVAVPSGNYPRWFGVSEREGPWTQEVWDKTEVNLSRVNTLLATAHAGPPNSPLYQALAKGYPAKPDLSEPVTRVVTKQDNGFWPAGACTYCGLRPRAPDQEHADPTHRHNWSFGHGDGTHNPWRCPCKRKWHCQGGGDEVRDPQTKQQLIECLQPAGGEQLANC